MQLKMTVSIDGKIYFVDNNGRRFNEEGFLWSTGFFDDGIAKVAFKKGKFYRYMFLNISGNWVSDECFIKADDGFTDGFVRVMREDGEWYYLDYKGGFYSHKP
jgi:hypothetical protein